MNIKDKIGQRIMQERKAKKLTRKALAELTDDLKESRINNWERGTRTPGPEEIKQLATALEVSPAYLMCLTDVRHPQIAKTHIQGLVPLLNAQEACIAKDNLTVIIKLEDESSRCFIPISSSFNFSITENTFALKMFDDSMDPEVRVNDILIIDPDISPLPGSLVLAKIDNSEKAIVRKYKQLTISKNNKFELIALNPNWGNIQSGEEIECELLGTVIGLNRVFQ
ncbi:LexA family transcriptional repressor [Legionella quinlivanii]|uniref:LexA family transcriptional repressor n=1 Tax=Legionella quinlivanii TaxID=45073 RepID=A0A364LJE5_9GAMM|nr:S24 family peptidase [Legionella quinlivanii]RAP36652.1 LexA family transcriptional repressor [Legionella quinlivanii]